MQARIVTDQYNGYEVQVKYKWWPFWIMPGCNTHTSIEEAEKWWKITYEDMNFKSQVVVDLPSNKSEKEGV